jgi:hypothetical protein
MLSTNQNALSDDSQCYSERERVKIGSLVVPLEANDGHCHPKIGRHIPPSH